jgi:hypothetical protein
MGFVLVRLVGPQVNRGPAKSDATLANGLPLISGAHGEHHRPSRGSTVCWMPESVAGVAATIRPKETQI